jgi:hypothetical protein
MDDEEEMIENFISMRVIGQEMQAKPGCRGSHANCSAGK